VIQRLASRHGGRAYSFGLQWCRVSLDCFDEYEKLLKDFSSLRHKVAGMAEPSEDEFVRMARVGFGVHGSHDGWRQRHADIVHEYLSECEAQGDSKPVRMFYALAQGMILGAIWSGKLDEDSYRKAWILLPGFVIGKSREIES
jgi:hypothetical protein